MERTAGRYLALLLAFVMVLTGSGQVFAVDTADTAVLRKLLKKLLLRRVRILLY